MTNLDKNWKVEFFGEGTSWVAENLTMEQAEERVDNCPSEYMAYMVPMTEDDYGFLHRGDK